jgi:Peptidase family S41/Peptidase S41 N-terminal domain
MKKIGYLLSVYLLFSVAIISCSKSEGIVAPQNIEVQDFIWEGMNLYYLWKDNVPNLSDSKVDDATEYINFLSSAEPDLFFENLIYDRTTTDKWSWIVDDYIALENLFSGISTSNGVEYGLFYETGSSTDIFGYVRYILPNTDASAKNVMRGYIFDAIDGQKLTLNNYKNLLGQDAYTMNFADLNGGDPVSNDISVDLIKSTYTENPVYITKTFDINGVKIGYLMYNGFTSNFDQQLNSAFAQLKADGATELVLDLRYNSGGSVRSATYLASMITGQYTGQLFAKERWNNMIQEWFEANRPERINNNFTNEIIKYNDNNEIILQEAINSLNLSKVYIIATGSSASASELVINGLKPYIDIVTIGTTTLGKYTGSVTLYDSENFSKSGAGFNQNHTWAMQPIVLETVNKLGNNVKGGILPTYEIIEYIDEMQKLGDVSEPLLEKAIEIITGVSSRISRSNKNPLNFKKFFDSKDLKRFGNDMYVDKELPYFLINRE